jgi:hypothetical protein
VPLDQQVRQELQVMQEPREPQVQQVLLVQQEPKATQAILRALQELLVHKDPLDRKATQEPQVPLVLVLQVQLVYKVLLALHKLQLATLRLLHPPLVIYGTTQTMTYCMFG